MSKFDKYGEAGKYMQMLMKSVFAMLLTILLSFFLGLYFVNKFKLPTGWLMGFIFLGIAISFYYIYSLFRKEEQ